MRNCLTLCCVIVAISCKAPEYYYQSHHHQPLSFYQQMLGTVEGASKKIDSIQVFEADLQAVLVSRDNVGEKAMVNTESEQPTLAYPSNTYEHRLYIFRFFTESPLDDEIIFMQTTFRGNCFEEGDDLSDFDSSNCHNMGLGPAYYGKIRSNQLAISHVIKMNKKRDFYVPVKSEAQRMRFILREPLSKRVPQQVWIDELLVLDATKVGGSKPLQYRLPALFSDSSAFKFRYTNTLIKTIP